MARTPRCRRIRGYPEYWSFAPQGDGQPETITMSLDEYECIRLMDREKLTQEQCARRMGVARTTVTNIYESARSKLAEVLDDFFAFVGDSIVLGHDIGYNDIMNINMACRRFHRRDLFLPKFLDTERIAKRLLPTQTGGKFGLDALMKYYNLQADGEHRALADCYSAWALYRCLLREYENKKEEL